MLTRGLLLLGLAGILPAQKLVEGPDGDCGFSSFKPRHITHFADKGVVSKATPIYPATAKARDLSGTVRVRVLIDKQGVVARTCPMFAVGEPKPDRSLIVVSEAAALQWTFQPNFGIQPSSGLRFDYAHDVLLFRFEPAALRRPTVPGR